MNRMTTEEEVDLLKTISEASYEELKDYYETKPISAFDRVLQQYIIYRLNQLDHRQGRTLPLLFRQADLERYGIDRFGYSEAAFGIKDFT